MKLLVILVALVFALPSYAQSPLEELRARVRDAMRAGADDGPLKELEEAANDVESIALRVERQLDDSMRFLREIGPCGSPAPTPVTTAADTARLADDVDRAVEDLDKARDAVEELLVPKPPDEVRRALHRVLAAADDMLTRARESSAGSNWLRRFTRELNDGELCEVVDHLLPLPEPFTLEELRKDPLVPLRRAGDAVHQHIVERHNALMRGEWSLGLGAMWTPMKVNGETRAGQPIAMLSFRPRREDWPFFRDASIRPWVQVGTGLQFDEPSFYVGGAIDLGPYAHVGVGWTAQQIETNGEEEFDGDVYVSMNIRVDRLREWFSR